MRRFKRPIPFPSKMAMNGQHTLSSGSMLHWQRQILPGGSVSDILAGKKHIHRDL
jgi:hypothetical protein